MGNGKQDGSISRLKSLMISRPSGKPGGRQVNCMEHLKLFSLATGLLFCTFYFICVFLWVIVVQISQLTQNPGHLASREGFRRDAGQPTPNPGRPGKSGTSGNPKVVLTPEAKAEAWTVTSKTKAKDWTFKVKARNTKF